MEADVLNAAGHALFIILDPSRLLLVFAGVCMGLSLGLLPGIGGVAGMALLLPFTYDLDPAAAMALLLGLGATTTTADPISAIVLGAPGHAASAATTLDGYPMTKRGEAGRALGASYMAAMLGGLFGAALMAVSIPVLRPLILQIGAPEMFALAVFGISMVAALSGNTPLRGLAVACFGMMLAMIGSAPQTGTLRWTMGQLYLWEGLPLVPLTLGIFALPELCDLAVKRSSVVGDNVAIDTRKGLLEGAKDCFRHWFLVLRCSWIGAAMGAVPGIGSSVIDWISYAHALRTERGAAQSFGKGDVRGVIAAESATNSREGGALVPTVAFGVPSSAGMAILLGAFLMHGLVPGPDMISKNLDVTYAMVWTLAIANLLGSGLCFLFSGQFARLATLRYTVILPCVLSLIYIGAFEGKRMWGDLYSLLFFGILGWTLKHLKWPRPPLVLGFILGGMLERYMFISIQRFGWGWLTRPVVLILFFMAFLSLMRPLFRGMSSRDGLSALLLGYGAPRFKPSHLFTLALLTLFGVMLREAWTWSTYAKIVPMIVGGGAALFAFFSLVNDVFRHPLETATPEPGSRHRRRRSPGLTETLHMDIASDVSHLAARTVLVRGAIFFGWMVGFLASMALIGLIPTVPIFILAYMRIEGREGWRLALALAGAMTLLIYILFDRLLSVPWPPTLIGDLFPTLHAIPSV